MDNNNKDIEQRSSFEETNTHIGSCGSAHIDDPHSAILVDNWSEIYNSKALAKTNEGKLCGNVVAEYNDNIVLIDFAASNLQEYLVPKSIIERYDGEYLYLTISHNVLMSYGY
jgi:hypothetical protein